MKQSVKPMVAAIATVIVIFVLGLIGYRIFTATGSSSLPQANIRPADPNDERFKPKLPEGISGGNN
ncbi:MAG: hypothetical protein JWL77_1402 [Chthonomonadaceae bacterium]|nr:hypothetical protein [Chthonomonadaceae bacterium]